MSLPSSMRNTYGMDKVLRGPQHAHIHVHTHALALRIRKLAIIVTSWVMWSSYFRNCTFNFYDGSQVLIQHCTAMFKKHMTCLTIYWHQWLRYDLCLCPFRLVDVWTVADWSDAERLDFNYHYLEKYSYDWNKISLFFGVKKINYIE